MRNILNKFRGLTKEENPWLYKLKHELNAPLVSRTVAVNNTDYLNHLKTPDSLGKIIPYKTRKHICEHLPEKFWLTEISLPDLYVANKTVLINYISDLQSGKLLCFRFPKFCIIFRKTEEPEIIELDTLGHFKLFSLDHSTDTFDW